MNIIKERERITNTWLEREFSDELHNGFSFPCDKNGNILPSCSEIAKRNFQDCIDGKFNDLIDRGVIENKNAYMSNAIGVCECGNKVELRDEYYGTCQCSNCGEWYNLAGQHVLAPDQYNIDSSY